MNDRNQSASLVPASGKPVRQLWPWVGVPVVTAVLVVICAIVFRERLNRLFCREWQMEAFNSSTIGGISFVKTSLHRGSARIECSMILFGESEVEVVVIDNGLSRAQPRFANLSEAMRKSGCFGGSNGGFFDMETFEPNGLMISDGKTTGVFDPKNWAKGVFAVRNSTPMLINRDRFIMEMAIRQALQAGPWLVRDAKSQRGFQNDDAAHPRTFLATDGHGMWALAHASETTLGNLAQMLGSEPPATSFKIRAALNLDGGPSSGLWYRLNDQETYIEERTVIRNFVGLRRIGGPLNSQNWP